MDLTGAPGAEAEAGFLSWVFYGGHHVGEFKISGLDLCSFNCRVYPHDFHTSMRTKHFKDVKSWHESRLKLLTLTARV